MNEIPLKEYIDLRINEIKAAVDMLKIYEDTRFNDAQEAIKLRTSVNQTAVDKAEQGINRRLETMNEFRGQLKDQTAQFITRDEYNVTKDQMQKNVVTAREEASHYVTRAEFAAIQRLVYIGMGGVIAIEILLRFLVK